MYDENFLHAHLKVFNSTSKKIELLSPLMKCKHTFTLGLVFMLLAYLMACMWLMNACVIPAMETELMFLFCSWLYSMSTCGIILWNKARKKKKASSSSILTKPPASLFVGASNPSLLRMVWKHLTRSSLCTHTVLTARLLKFQRVADELGRRCATTSCSIS